jgi:Holliday junction resolvase
MSKKSPKYSRNKGHNYERKIVKELNELGFQVGTSRNNSKKLDNDKIDIYDEKGNLPCKIQLKSTQNIPQYFKIRSESTVNPEEFVII